MTTTLFRPILALLLMVLGCNSAQAAPKSEPWPMWEAHNEASVGAISHEPWERFLASYVKTAADGINRVAYQMVTAESRKQLEDYLARLQTVPIRKYARAEQRAYWINLYNAETVWLVISHPNAGGIRDIKLGGLFSSGPWDAKLLKVEGEPLSTNMVTFGRPKHIELAKDPGLTVKARANQDGSFRVSLKVKRPALWCWLELEGADARYSDNFVHLRPGRAVTVTVTPAGPMAAKAFERKLKVRSLVDTFV